MVGWVERSEPHRVDEQAMVGLAALDPPYTPLFSVLAGKRSMALPGRVAPGDCSPGAPTDPDVQDYRIRFLK